MNYAKIPYKSANSSTSWIEHEIIILFAEAGLVARDKKRKKVYGMYTLVQKEDKHFLCNGRCTICFDTNASGAEVITDTKKSRKLNHQIH